MTSTVTCDYTAASWELNSQGQNACQVYAALQGICDPSFTIQSVTSSSPAYTPLNNACGCNLVAYNLMAGCGWCQSSILTGWWLTESGWSNYCTTVPYVSTGLPSNFTAITVNIPSWAFLQPTGTTWSPTQAQAFVSGTAYPTTIYSGSYTSYTEFTSVQLVLAILAIALASLLALNLLLGIVGVILHFVRQEKRRKWYGPMARYYENLKFGGIRGGDAAAANQPLIYNMNNSAYQNSTSSLAVSPPSTTGYTYKPPSTGQSNGGYTAVPNPGYGVGPGMTSTQTGPISAVPGGYKGYAEV